MNSGQKITAIYAYTATASQAEGNIVLRSQEQRCMEYCQEHGYFVGYIFSEASNGTTDHNSRPALTRLREGAQQHNFALVIVTSLKRLSRNQTQSAAIIDELQEHGVTVESIDDQNGTDITALAQAVKAEVAKIERQMINKRIKCGKAAKKAQREQQQ